MNQKNWFNLKLTLYFIVMVVAGIVGISWCASHVNSGNAETLIPALAAAISAYAVFVLGIPINIYLTQSAQMGNYRQQWINDFRHIIMEMENVYRKCHRLKFRRLSLEEEFRTGRKQGPRRPDDDILRSWVDTMNDERDAFEEKHQIMCRYVLMLHSNTRKKRNFDNIIDRLEHTISPDINGEYYSSRLSQITQMIEKKWSLEESDNWGDYNDIERYQENKEHNISDEDLEDSDLAVRTAKRVLLREILHETKEKLPNLINDLMGEGRDLMDEYGID